MDLGLSGFDPSLVWLAQAINAKWARFSINVLDDMGASADRLDELFHYAHGAGCKCLLDATGTMGQFAAMVTSHHDPDDWQRAVGVYIERSLSLLRRHPEIDTLEVWGSADIPIIVGGRGPQFDASTILARVYQEVKEAMPWLRVASCGYGINAETTFLQCGLAEHAPTSFDLYNTHPLLWPGENLESSAARYRSRLHDARVLLKQRCADQPLTVGCFGIPTVRGVPPPELNIGTHWQLPGGVRGVDYAEAHLWYREMAQVFEEAGALFCCFEAHDVMRGGLYRHWQGACGLLTEKGSPKDFLYPLTEWAQDRAPFDMELEDVSGAPTDS